MRNAHLVRIGTVACLSAGTLSLKVAGDVHGLWSTIFGYDEFLHLLAALSMTLFIREAIRPWIRPPLEVAVGFTVGALFVRWELYQAMKKGGAVPVIDTITDLSWGMVGILVAVYVVAQGVGPYQE